jgi:hypothetical protein
MTDPVYAQLFCTAAELDDDLNLLGSVRADVLMDKIAAASDYLQKQIGWFIPVTMTRYFNGLGRAFLYLPPLLALTGSIVNDDDTLVSADFIYKPDGRHWANGPYTRLDIDPDAANLSVWMNEDEGITIPGRWGMYEETEDTGATVADTTQQSASQTTLKVSSGAKVSPGMVLLIGTEQEHVTGWNTPTAAVTTLGAAWDAQSSEVTLAAASLNIGEVGRVGLEKFKVLDNNSTLYYAQRGWDKTRQASHSNGATVDVYRTVDVVRGVNGTTAAIHANGAAISRYKAPSDINYLCRQIAALMLKKAQGGFAGKTGNEDLGTVTYNNEFPMIALKEIKKSYKIYRLR